FYKDLKNNPTAYSTSPANVEEFAAAFEAEAAQGHDILAMALSSGISGTYNFMCSARKIVLEKYPDVNIRCIDTLRYGPGFGLLTIHASMQRSAGKTLDETAEYIEANRSRFHQAGYMDDLAFVAKKGRLTHAKAFFGMLAGIKAIGECDSNGLTTVLTKVKGTKLALDVLIDYMANTITEPEEQIIFIAQTNRLPQAEIYKKMIEDTFHPKAVYINDVFPACGINIGPGLMSSYYMGKEISHDLSVERAILEKAAKGE
ncbi:MAG TPA: DegV family protein, partial [Clostridia bacterium]|nr:DegV family protein [Clostridia bacterium]